MASREKIVESLVFTMLPCFIVWGIFSTVYGGRTTIGIFTMEQIYTFILTLIISNNAYYYIKYRDIKKYHTVHNFISLVCFLCIIVVNNVSVFKHLRILNNFSEESVFF